MLRGLCSLVLQGTGLSNGVHVLVLQRAAYSRRGRLAWMFGVSSFRPAANICTPPGKTDRCGLHAASLLENPANCRMFAAMGNPHATSDCQTPCETPALQRQKHTTVSKTLQFAGCLAFLDPTPKTNSCKHPGKRGFSGQTLRAADSAAAPPLFADMHAPQHANPERSKHGCLHTMVPSRERWFQSLTPSLLNA